MNPVTKQSWRNYQTSILDHLYRHMYSSTAVPICPWTRIYIFAFWSTATSFISTASISSVSQTSEARSQMKCFPWMMYINGAALSRWPSIYGRLTGADLKLSLIFRNQMNSCQRQHCCLECVYGHPHTPHTYNRRQPTTDWIGIQSIVSSWPQHFFFFICMKCFW
jgi:hypothetical protein